MGRKQSLFFTIKVSSIDGQLRDLLKVSSIDGQLRDLSLMLAGY